MRRSARNCDLIVIDVTVAGRTGVHSGGRSVYNLNTVISRYHSGWHTVPQN